MLHRSNIEVCWQPHLTTKTTKYHRDNSHDEYAPSVSVYLLATGYYWICGKQKNKIHKEHTRLLCLCFCYKILLMQSTTHAYTLIESTSGFIHISRSHAHSKGSNTAVQTTNLNSTPALGLNLFKLHLVCIKITEVTCSMSPKLTT